MSNGLFADRAAAGRVLARTVADQLHQHPAAGATGPPLVLALPRGGVPVAVEVAAALGADFDVLVARKVGVPWQPELGAGAVTDEGPPVWHAQVLRTAGLSPAALADGAAREQAEARRQLHAYRGNRPPPRVAGRAAVVVDDGLATGITARAALRTLRRSDPALLVFAAPVCAADAARDLMGEADMVICTRTPTDFLAVGAWYHDFDQLSDEQVERILDESRPAWTR
jgi:predicted phosphoribosyltransferase